MTTHHFVAIAGSLRKNSFNKSLLEAVKARAPEGTTIEILSIDAIPLFNQDLETDFPGVVTALKEKIMTADGIIIATPEYGRSVPGVLKNVFDWTSRPYGMSAWKGKPVYVMGATDGAVGTAVAQKEARADLTTAGGIVLGQPEFYLSGMKSKVDAEGKLVDEKTLEHIDSALAAFTAFVDKIH